jgi:hypothetical protein
MKNLMITMDNMECVDAKKLLKSKDIETIIDAVLMCKKDKIYSVYCCAKLTVEDKDYDKAMEILKQNKFTTGGIYKSDEFIDVAIAHLNQKK